MAFKICNKFNIEYNLVDTVLSIRSSIITWDSAYSGTTRIIPQDVQLIIKDELPDFTQIGKTKLADLSYILNQKIDIIEEYNKSTSRFLRNSDIKKHEKDLIDVVIKFNNL
jgi:hypothetical protein